MSDECYRPDPEHINMQSDDNKQGRKMESVDPSVAQEVLALLEQDQKRSYENYQKLLDMGIARELARVDLPLSLYTEWYWQMDLHNLFHFLQLRLDPHAQYEIRVYAQTILEMVRKVCPIATEAFEEHKVGSTTFSNSEMQALKEMLTGKENPLTGRAKELFDSKLN
jgi:thymidylate synthase (FAD)